MNNMEKLASLNERLHGVPRSPERRVPDNGKTLQTGQLWTLAPVPGATDTDDTPSFLVLLVEDLDEGFFNAIPVYRWTELAGPGDLIVPGKITGTRLTAALSLEATVNRGMLDQCEGRFPPPVVDYILEAAGLDEEDSARNRFNWGPGWFGPHDHRRQYATFIADTLATLQASVREVIYGESQNDENIIPFPREAFARYDQRLAAAESGERVTPCLILCTSPLDLKVVKEGDEAIVLARNQAFDPLIPGSTEPICCEWQVPFHYSAIPPNPEALIYDSRTGRLVGKADITVRDNETLLTLTEFCLDGEAPPIEDPAALRIVIREK